MPVYEYECLKCKHRFEKVRPVNFRDRPAFCPKCDGPCKKLVSAPVLRENLGTKLRAKLDKQKPPGHAHR